MYYEIERYHIQEGCYYLCKKDLCFGYSLDSDFQILLDKGKCYKVVKTERLWVKLENEIILAPTIISSYANRMFYDYFHTLEETRKIKLEKIYESNKSKNQRVSR